MAYDPENNPYIPGDPASYDLKWVVDRLNEHKFAEESAAEAKASAEAAAASASEASGYADNAEGYADNAEGYAEAAAEYRDEAADYAAHIADPVSGLVTSWLADHITNPSNPPIDTSLSVGGAAADAEVTGDEIRLIGYDNIRYQLDTQSISGTSAYNGSYIATNIAVKEGAIYYLSIGSVVDCITDICASIRLRIGSTVYRTTSITVTDVSNGISVPILNDSASVDNIQLILYRNASASTSASGTTVFTDVKITVNEGGVVGIANNTFDLEANNDFNSLKNEVKKIEDDLSSSNIVFNSDLVSVDGNTAWLAKNYAVDDIPVFGETYYLHIGKVENCQTANCARIALRSGSTVISYAILSVTDVANGLSANVSVASSSIDNIQINLYRNASASTVTTGTTIFKDITVIKGSADVKFIPQSKWSKKKIAWFGTSIPAGSYDGTAGHTYPRIVGSLLNATVFNEAVGSSSISRTIPSAISTANPYGFDTTDFEYAARCLTNDITMQNWLIANYNAGFFINNVPGSMDAATQARILSYSYENKLDKYLSGGSIGNVDLYVFDHGYNEYYHNRDVEQLETDYGLDTTYCFDGGMNFLIRRILTDDPDAKIVIISHYTDNATDSIHNTTAFVEKVKEAQMKVAQRWSIKFINIFEKLGWSGQLITTNGYWDANDEWINTGGPAQTLQIKDIHVRDTVHPYTDASGKSNNRIAEILAAELDSIIR